MGDLLHSNGNFISQKELEQKYTLLKTNFLEYLRVKMCVELYLKKYREDGPLLFDQPCIPKQIASLFGHSQGSKHFYKLLNKTCADMSFKTAWDNELNINIDEDEDTWQKIASHSPKLSSHSNKIASHSHKTANHSPKLASHSNKIASRSHMLAICSHKIASHSHKMASHSPS